MVNVAKARWTTHHPNVKALQKVQRFLGKNRWENLPPVGSTEMHLYSRDQLVEGEGWEALLLAKYFMGADLELNGWDFAEYDEDENAGFLDEEAEHALDWVSDKIKEFLNVTVQPDGTLDVVPMPETRFVMANRSRGRGPPNQCTCGTANGARCKNNVVPGTGTCARHVHKTCYVWIGS